MVILDVITTESRQRLEENALETLVQSSDHLTFAALAGLSVGQDQEDTASFGAAGATANSIGIEVARAAALQHAGISAKDVYDLSVEAELDERIPHYEVEFKSGGMEYGYEIDASTGAVLQYETERDD